MSTVMNPFNWLRPARRWALATNAFLMFLAVWMLFTAPAQAVLQAFGPIDPANGFPTWYQDTTGLSLEFCENQTQDELNGGWCALLPPNVPTGLAPETFPNNFSIEHFYWLGNSLDRRVPIPGTTQSTLVGLFMSEEGSFVNNVSVINGDQMVFARIRIKLTPVPFTGAYTVYTPFGKFDFPNEVAGDRLFFTQDVGLAPQAFAMSLNGRVGPFLLPSATPGGAEVPPLPGLLPGQDPFYDALVAAGAAKPVPATGKKYLADPGRLGPVTGSSLPPYVVNDGTTRDPNIFRIEGPNGFVFESTTFTVTGRVYTGAIAGALSVDRASYARSATAQKVDVYATADPVTQGRVPGALPPAVITPALSYFDAPCTPTLDAAGNPGLPYSAPVGAVANQMFAQGNKYFGHSAPTVIPPAVCVSETAANAAGQTVTTFTPANLGDQIFITGALYDPASQNLSVSATSSDLVVPQTLTVQGYGNIDPITGQLVVPAQLAAPESVTVVSSGGGQNTYQMATGAVAGIAGGATTPAPVAVNDLVTMFEDCAPLAAGQLAQATTGCAAPQIINVLANDTNATGGTVSLVGAPLLGTAVVNLDGTIGYTPNLNANGTDTISYKVTVGTQVSNVATVTVNITPVNDAPVAINDTIGALRGFPISISVLANDTDPDGVADLASAKIVTGNASLGIVAGTVYAGGVITFTPPASLTTGPYLFTYNAVDKGGAASAIPATVTVNVSATEAIIVAKDIYTQSKGRWTVQGTISPVAGQTMSMTYDLSTAPTYKVNGVCTALTSANNPVVGTATVDALGNWLYDQLLANTSGLLNPSNTLGNSTGFWCNPPKNLRITSSLTGGTVTSAISLK
ncbi:MAG TPA: Ig-like domain-containing protein [Candidatus Methylomirabilis sp.]|nr:Ig-like domain-containing protein [Candidatus Methylomirabilis sp.]